MGIMNHMIDSGRTTTALLLLAVLFLLGLTVPLWGAEQQLNTVPIPGPPHAVTAADGTVRMMPARAVADRLIIKLRPHIGPQQVGTLAAAGNSRVRKVLPLSGLVIIDLPSGSDLMAAARQFESRPEVEFAVPDTLVYPALIPNDPEYSQQWHLPKIAAPLAWDVTTGTDTVTIAVVDSGCDMDHPDLVSKIWTNPGEIPGNEIDDDGNGYVDDVHGYDIYHDDGDPTPQPLSGSANDVVSHGTLVAGTAAAVGNNSWGTAGIDWQAQIMVLQVFGRDGSEQPPTSISMVAEAIDYATANGADIINLSIGGGYSAAFSPPINTAYESGKLVIAAAGNNYAELTNDDYTWKSPVCNDGPNPLIDNYVLGVTATDSDDRKPGFANWDGSTANFVDVAAPGVNIYGPAFYDPSYPGFDEYWYTNNGTSFSTPIASGLAALIIAHNPGLRGNPAAVYQIIRDTTDNIDPQNPGYAGKLGTGRINAARALGVSIPPAAVTNLQAADTTGDQGGSITLTWLKSADDGGGSNNITSYIVRRRTGASGPFSNIDSLPPGTQQYDDTSVTDGVDYYYIIRTVADALHTDSEIAGPAQSRNDLAPPQITTLTARDRPSDSGGAIELEWTYSPPADFDFYSLYRSNRNFNTVEDRTALTTFTNPATSAWTDTSVVDGADYYYAITATDDVGNENQLVETAGPVQSYPNDEMPFEAGLQLLSTPAIPPDQHPATLFDIPPGDLIDRYARYDRVDEHYVIYLSDPLSEILKLDLARGFWVDLPYPVNVTPEGTSAPSGDFPVPLQPGWHLLGNPFFGPTDFGAATVFQDGTYDMLSAHRLGILCAVAWVYDVEDHSYKMISADSIGQRQIAPWGGFWLLAYESCTFTIARPTGTSAATTQADQSSAEDNGWSLRLVAESSTSRDTDNFCGLRPAAVVTKVDNPPAVATAVDLYLLDGDSDRRLAASFATQAVTEYNWDVVVTWPHPASEISLTWPTINELPDEYEATLQDLDGGGTVNLRLRPRYVFNPQEAGSRRFRLTVTPTSSQPVTLTSVAALPTRGGAEVVFTLSRPAQCGIRIMNIAGRTIRILETDRAHTAGQNVVLWDGRADTGSSVPSGRYLIQIEANATNGTTARALRTLNVIR